MPPRGTIAACDFSSASCTVQGKGHRLSDRQTGLCMNSAMIGTLLNVLCERTYILHGCIGDSRR